MQSSFRGRQSTPKSGCSDGSSDNSPRESDSKHLGEEDFSIPVLGRLRQEDLCELEASVVYRLSFRTDSECYTEKPGPTKTKQKNTTHTHTKEFPYTRRGPQSGNTPKMDIYLCELGAGRFAAGTGLLGLRGFRIQMRGWEE